MIPFKIALNASTLFPFKLDVRQQIETAAQAGFTGIEFWMQDIEAYAASGGSLRVLGMQLRDAGLTAANAIAFFAWADADAAVRAQAFMQAEREMQLLAELGCRAVAAPPYGAVAETPPETMAVAFADLVELGRRIGVEPYLEFWGRAARLSRLSEALEIARLSGVADARLLLDPFHMYTGGSAVSDIAALQGSAIGMVHVNDYPAQPPRATIADRDRLFPGEGIAPSHELAQLLHQVGYTGYLSLELFIEDYGTATALDVAQRGHAAVTRTYRVG